MSKNNSELIQKHFELEKQWAQKIKATAKGSQQRKQYLEQGYNDIFNLIDEYKIDRYGEKYNSLMASLVSKFALASDKILDLGCGHGLLVLDLLNKGFNAHGIDVSSTGINKAKKNLLKINKQDRVKVGDILGEEDKFDGIIINNVIEHIVEDEIEDVINKCHKLLNPGGWIFIITPHRFSGPHDVSRYFLPLGSPAQGFHFKEFSLSDLYSLLSGNNFNNFKAYCMHPKILSKLNIICRPHSFCFRKNLFFEKLMNLRILQWKLKIHRKISQTITALFFPSIIIARKK